MNPFGKGGGKISKQIESLINNDRVLKKLELFIIEDEMCKNWQRFIYIIKQTGRMRLKLCSHLAQSDFGLKWDIKPSVN